MSTFNRFQKAEELYENEDYIGALSMFEKLETAQTDSDIQNYIGCCFLQTERYAEAIEIFTKLIEQNPEWSRPVYNLGRVYLKQSRFSEALMYFQKALSINPHDADANYYLGVYYEKTENYDDAIACYQKSVSLAPNEFEPHMGLAVCYGAIHDNQKSLTESKIAFQLFDCPDTLYNYTSCLIKAKEYQTAFDLLKSQKTEACDDEGLLMNLMYSALKVNDYDICLQCAEKLPDNELVKYVTGQCE